MQFHTFGNDSNKVMILIHGMLTPWQIWEDAAEYFSTEYYVVVPELDAHTEDVVTRFRSVEDEAEQIRAYAVKNFDGKLSAICGLSMGGRIAAELAAMPDISVDHLVLDGAPLVKLPGFLVGIMEKNYISLIKKAKVRDYKVIEDCKKNFLPERYLNAFLKIANNMDEQSVSAILSSVFSKFEYKKYSSDMKILFMHGTKGNEMFSKKAAAKMKEVNPQTEIRCYSGYNHAQLACFEIDKWTREVADFVSD